ncbi:MAG: YeeE/YedE thiosulfate transporter family protein [Planctomycetaceae bacterium]|nr:YeeE/YedE thiosulfate transporter family protein [Planctomycetaceae bacterium]
MFDSPERLMLGLVTGVVFGVLLQKGRVAKFPVIIGQFILKDWTVAKVMGTAVVVGSVGVYALVASGHANLHVKPFLLGGVLLGGLCFGVGMAVYGYCPGTGVAACGEGKPDAMVGVLGMLVGAWVFVVAFPALQPVIKGLGDMGKLTLPEATSTSPWLWVAALVGVGLAALALLPSRRKSVADEQHRSDKPGVRAGSSV